MNVWTFYLMTSLIAVFINALYLQLLIVNTTEKCFSSESSVKINLLLILLYWNGQLVWTPALGALFVYMCVSVCPRS